MKARLQLALDDISIEAALELLEKVEGLVDIIEVGTPFIVKYGMLPVREIRKRFPNQVILADVKIADGARIEAKDAFEAGADIVTVLALCETQTIKDAVKVAREYGKEVLVDMLAVKDIPTKTKELESMDVDYISVHNAFDVQALGKNPLDELLILNKCVTKTKTAVAGGVKLQTLPEIVKAEPNVVIVGGAITGAEDPRKAVLEMLEIIHKGE